MKFFLLTTTIFFATFAITILAKDSYPPSIYNLMLNDPSNASPKFGGENDESIGGQVGVSTIASNNLNDFVEDDNGEFTEGEINKRFVKVIKKVA